MESYRRANPEEIDPLQGILRQLTRVGNSLEALEDIARWHVSIFFGATMCLLTCF